ncbi:hypothetical protein EVAR_62523_1 [Eumeta japonica]|uniref:Uncharacterized protein n=1 Tax=Eumeta variegata TaxID=151549 RepID=A0A4C1ZJX9_EUMVA|nr:hypothetical protein EVAR_62523_1 [Eumeta japonica]
MASYVLLRAKIEYVVSKYINKYRAIHYGSRIRRAFARPKMRHRITWAAIKLSASSAPAQSRSLNDIVMLTVASRVSLLFVGAGFLSDQRSV